MAVIGASVNPYRKPRQLPSQVADGAFLLFYSCHGNGADALGEG